MKRINETLWKDYDRADHLVESHIDKDEGCKLWLEERDKIRNELLKYEQTAIEAELKKLEIEKEAEVKAAQINADNEQKKYSNWITVGTFTASLAFSVIGLYKTFYFDDKATVTSTLGRAILNGTLPKMPKK